MAPNEVPGHPGVIIPASFPQREITDQQLGALRPLIVGFADRIGRCDLPKLEPCEGFPDLRDVVYRQDKAAFKRS